MPPISVHQDLLNQYLISMIMREVLRPADQQRIELMREQNDLDINSMLSILLTRYPNGRTTVPKSGNIHLAWEFMQNPAHHDRFINMLRVSPLVFETILTLIEEHPVFTNNSNNAQTPVEQQLAVTLFRLGRYGNGASVEDIAREAGCSEGSKEVEKKWMDEHLGFRGKWREGWLMYDGTIVVLYKKPGLNGDAYYTRKGNYGLNAQVRIHLSCFSDLLI
ncbi:hypothetical protein GALMADRAFT_60335 [Galerina marginata CBS 339.88]|uniref:Uncharacterized protein n=1 Tax=Galerina marginata (strain CBS 339.88) TaxID=685588 RepID=A0A067TG79_GALM3|nr:hypothetical protein GALMADRAFT_60335 [Galerina marginata CBS 339.88]